MKRLMSALFASVLSVGMVASSLMPTQAAPVFTPKAPIASSDVETVQYREWRRHNRGGREFRGDFRGGREMRRGSFRNNERLYYNGHRGSRYYRDGWRRHNGAWYPAGAFIAGAIIGGALSNDGPRVVRRGGNAHIQWCFDRYRSYRASDNTYVPRVGVRAYCNSPYN